MTMPSLNPRLFNSYSYEFPDTCTPAWPRSFKRIWIPFSVHVFCLSHFTSSLLFFPAYLVFYFGGEFPLSIFDPTRPLFLLGIEFPLFNFGRTHPFFLLGGELPLSTFLFGGWFPLFSSAASSCALSFTSRTHCFCSCSRSHAFCSSPPALS